MLVRLKTTLAEAGDENGALQVVEPEDVAAKPEDRNRVATEAEVPRDVG